MKFSEIEIGQSFVFSFDRLSGVWKYKKISERRIECIGKPKTESEEAIGKIWDFRDPEAECIYVQDLI